MLKQELIIVLILLSFACLINYYLAKFSTYTTRKHGRMIAALIGFTHGLFASVCLSYLWDQPYQYAASVGIIVGVGTGWYTGIYSTLSAIVNGAIAGVIGGGIGAYTMESIHPFFAPLLYMSASVFLFVIFFLLLAYVLYKIPVDQSVFVKRVIQHPFLVGPLLVVVFYGYQWIENRWNHNK